MTDETPKLWRDMTDAEKGALLLQWHEGKMREFFNAGQWEEDQEPDIDPDLAYRVRPGPKRETVTLYGCSSRLAVWMTGKRGPDLDTHRITFDLIDGEPDCEKCPTCGTAKHVDMERL